MKKDDFIERLTAMTKEEITEFLLAKGKRKEIETFSFKWNFDSIKK